MSLRLLLLLVIAVKTLVKISIENLLFLLLPAKSHIMLILKAEQQCCKPTQSSVNKTFQSKLSLVGSNCNQQLQLEKMKNERTHIQN